ncbi:MAG: DUF2262 domain-containing protein [Hymenobacter sp.]|nr:MAG: DUF2262 domain-containing protein [Hymenobacter sp.]
MSSVIGPPHYNLVDLLRQAQAGQPTPLTDFLRRFAPLAATNADQNALLVLRHFDAAPSQNQRRVLNCRPRGIDFQPGITIATYSGTGGGQRNAYLPTGFIYTGLGLHGQEVELVQADGLALTTNLTELGRKLDFWGTFSEDDLRAAFSRLCNERYAPSQPAVPAPSELVLELPGVGLLTYEPRYEWYAGSFTVAGQPVTITIAYAATPQLLPLQAWVAQQLLAHFWEPLLAAMTDQLLTLKNDAWLDEGEPELSKEAFQQRVTLSGIAFYADGSAAIYCNDDELFLGHTIEISVAENGKYRTAHLAG